MIVPVGINEGVLSQTGIMLINHSYKIQANACQSAIKIHELYRMNITLAALLILLVHFKSFSFDSFQD